MRPSRLIIETLFPDPDSPTTPSTSPGATEKDKPSTASAVPRRLRKLTRRSCTWSKGSGAGGEATLAPDPWGSDMADPRVKGCVHQVDQRVREHDEEGGVEHGSQDHRQVEVL